MLRYAKIPLAFLFIGSVLGVFLRWQFISPTSGVNYAYVLHGHSHIMFLGWIFNVLYIVFCHNHIKRDKTHSYNKLFFLLQLMVIGMLIAFPLQGYGFYSILFSTIHTLLVFVFVIKFFKNTNEVTSISVWYARMALLFLVISAVGPFSLGYLMSNHLEHSQWYYFSIYFYLHFQYNGFFLLGIFSLLFNQLEQKKVQFDYHQAKIFGWLTAMTCVPAYFLSTLWSEPGLLFNVIAGITAAVQLFTFYILLKMLIKCWSSIKKTFHELSISLLIVLLTAFALKLFLQFSSAFPEVARMSYQLRPVTIAYLHLVLIGFISTGLYVWYLELDLFRKTWLSKTFVLFYVSFSGMELCLVLSPWWRSWFAQWFFNSSQMIFFFSVLLCMSCFLFFLFSFKKQ